ncbi:Glycerophosphocholine phosphodiesterase [Orbilia javanica]|uniref:Glycerophosphocholine phosphodiesterase n=1 Tax=Orbilia javanica TaxID=47235 RepID=A0AAN8RNF1_9PEZI
MRFGRNLHLHQSPEWAGFYSDYPALKRLQKLACAQGANDLELQKKLMLEINLVERHYQRHCSLIEGKQADFYKWHGIPSNFPDTIIPQLLETNRKELEDILLFHIELSSEVKKLRLYRKLNVDGFHKIASKSTNLYFPSPELSKCSFYRGEFTLREDERLDRSITKLFSILQASTFSTPISLMLETHTVSLYPPIAYKNATICEAIRKDEISILEEILKVLLPESRGILTNALIFALLDLSLSFGALDCVRHLLSKVDSLHLPECRNILHRFVSRLGRRKSLGSSIQISHQDAEDSTKDIAGLIEIITLFPGTLLEKDLFGNLPLHHAARYGMLGACQKIMARMQECDQLDRKIPFNDVLLRNHDGDTPLHLAVVYGHITVTEGLLRWHRLDRCADPPAEGGTQGNDLSFLLGIAIRTNNPEIFQLLVVSPVDFSCRFRNGETIFHIAARSADEVWVKLLIDHSPQPQTNIEIPDKVLGWTPLIVAAVSNHILVVEALLSAGVDSETVDILGWTAKDHAAFRGNIKVAEKLNLLSTIASSSLDTVPFQADLGDVSRKLSTPYQESPATRSTIFVTLGSFDTKKKAIPVDMYRDSPQVFSKFSSSHLDTKFALRVRAIGANDLSYNIQLPILDDMTNKPWRFSAKRPFDVKIVFDILQPVCMLDEEGIVIGSAVGLLKGLQLGDGVVEKRESLVRDFTIPIQETKSLRFLGCITFSVLIVLPFPHSVLKPNVSWDSWSGTGSAMVIGHRGSGLNTVDNNKTGENTIKSFLDAIGDGASYVEFDVQLTKELTPVIYHDFLVQETGLDIPMQHIMLEQFMKLPRSFLEPFTTLIEVCQDLPETAGFDIEIKYPMLFECDDWKMEKYYIDANTFVDTILQTIFKFGGSRPIILSSFSPEVCILASVKQNVYPVMFLNDAGLSPTGDIRASSLQEAINFAKSLNLFGVVSASEPFVMSPKLVNFTKKAGLACASYGSQNSNPTFAKLQVQAGIDAIITDNVPLITKAIFRPELPN